MARFVPKEKLSKKAQKELNRQRRVTWDFSPVTKTVDSKTLFALGADRETVMWDYLLTNDYTASRLATIRQRIAPLGWPENKVDALLFMSGGVSEAYMNNGINALIGEYGSVEAYLAQELDVGKEARDALRRKLLV